MEIDSKDFNFRDIVFLNDRVILKLLQQVDSVTLAKSLYGSHELIQEKIFHSMSSLDCAMLKEDMEFMGSVGQEEVIEAQNNVLQITLALFESHVILL